MFKPQIGFILHTPALGDVDLVLAVAPTDFSSRQSLYIRKAAPDYWLLSAQVSIIFLRICWCGRSCSLSTADYELEGGGGSN